MLARGRLLSPSLDMADLALVWDHLDPPSCLVVCGCYGGLCLK